MSNDVGKDPDSLIWRVVGSELLWRLGKIAVEVLCPVVICVLLQTVEYGDKGIYSIGIDAVTIQRRDASATLAYISLSGVDETKQCVSRDLPDGVVQCIDECFLL